MRDILEVLNFFRNVCKSYFLFTVYLFYDIFYISNNLIFLIWNSYYDCGEDQRNSEIPKSEIFKKFHVVYI